MNNGNDFDFSFGGMPPQGPGQQDPFGPAPSRPQPTAGKGRWHAALTLSAFLTVALFSMGMAFLTRDMAERPVAVMGLIFMIPAAALMLGSMLVEGATSAMTPGGSRKAQWLVAAAAVASTFLVGCLCDLIYLGGFKAQDRIVMVIDKSPSMRSTSMGMKNYDELSVEAMEALLDGMGQSDLVGAVAFENEAIAAAPLAPKTAAQAEQVKQVIHTPLPAMGGTDFYAALDAALRMAEKGLKGDQGGARIVIITDGGSERWWSGVPGEETARIEPYLREILERCRVLNVSISGIQIGTEMTADLQGVIYQSGGQVYRATDAAALLSGVTKAASLKEKDLMRSDTGPAKTITFVMLLLEGTALGVCLSLMLSRRGQFRFQYILSPIMGLLAFLMLKVIFPHLITRESALWLAEGLSLSLLGVVFMRRNDAPAFRRPAPAQPSVSLDPFGF